MAEARGLDPDANLTWFELATRNLLDYLSEQKQATGVIPDDRTIVLERFQFGLIKNKKAAIRIVGVERACPGHCFRREIDANNFGEIIAKRTSHPPEATSEIERFAPLLRIAQCGRAAHETCSFARPGVEVIISEPLA